MLLASKTTLQLNSVAVEERGRRTLFLDHCIHSVMWDPCHRARSKVLTGATKHNTQLFKCSEPITAPFWKRFYTLRAERGNQGNLKIICNVDTATVGYSAIKKEFPCNILVTVKAHRNVRTCTWWQIPLLQAQPAPPTKDNSGQMLTCWPSVRHKQQTWCSWCVSNLTRACSLITEPVCVQSNMSGRQTGCTSAHQWAQHRKGTSGLLGRSYTDHASDFYPKVPRQE